MTDPSGLKKKMLFFGEIPPFSVNGISISNKLNINLLADRFTIDKVYERDIHSSVVKRAKYIVESCLEIFRESKEHDYDVFYLTISLSLLGILKTISMIVLFRLTNSHKKIITHIHRSDLSSFKQRSFIHRSAVNATLSLVDEVIVLSQKDAGNIPPTCEVAVLENTVEEEFSFTERKSPGHTFIYISNYIESKGIVHLITTFREFSRRYPGCVLECYGGVTDTELFERIKHFEDESIRVHTEIYGREKFARIHDSDCLILPSYNEGKPIVLLEAMSVGTPIIATNVGFVPELLGSDYRYLYDPTDPAALLEALEAFYHDEQKEQLAQYLQDRYYEKFSQSKHRERIYEIFAV